MARQLAGVRAERQVDDGDRRQQQPVNVREKRKNGAQFGQTKQCTARDFLLPFSSLTPEGEGLVSVMR